MFYRIRQFVKALRAKISVEDKEFVITHLNEAEMELFRGMSAIDQRHCVDVARTASGYAECGTGNVDVLTLVKAALLHDCGRKHGDMGIAGKVLAVVLDKIAGKNNVTRLLEYNIVSNSRAVRIMNVYYNHPELSARKMIDAGIDEALASLARKHHQPECAGDSIELLLLRRADASN